MAVTNEIVYPPRNPQVFLLTVAIRVGSDEGGVTASQIREALETKLGGDLEEIADELESDECPFAFYGMLPWWDTLASAELTGNEFGV